MSVRYPAKPGVAFVDSPIREETSSFIKDLSFTSSADNRSIVTGKVVLASSGIVGELAVGSGLAAENNSNLLVALAAACVAGVRALLLRLAHFCT